MTTTINNTATTTTVTLTAGQPGTQQSSATSSNASSTQPIVLKVQYNEDIRRVALPQLSLEVLTERVAEAFKIPAPRVVLKYQDDEGDLVTLGSPEDLDDAQRLAAQRKTVLRLVLSAKPKKCIAVVDKTAPAASSASPSPKDEASAIKEKRKILKEQRKLLKEEKKKLRHDAKEVSKHAKCEGKALLKQEKCETKALLKQEKCEEKKTRGCWRDLSEEERAARREAWRNMSEEERRALREERQRQRAEARGAHGDAPIVENKKRWRDMSEEERAAHRAARREARMKEDGDAPKNEEGIERRCWRHLTPEERAERRAALIEARRQRGDKGGCCPRNNRIARFVKHVTVPDGTTFEPNQSFVKTWRIRNEGAQELSNCKLVFVSRQNGDLLGAPEEIPVLPGMSVPSGQEFDISANMVAPKLPGRYVGFWRLANAEGRKFGQRIWVKIDVVSSSSSSDEEKDSSSCSSFKQLEDEVERSFIEIPSPCIEEEKKKPTFAESLKRLKELGFNDVATNIQLLKKHDGDVNKVIADLIA